MLSKKTVIPLIPRVMALEAAMMGRRRGDQASLFYELNDRIPKSHLLRHIDGFVTAALTDVRERLELYYSEIGRPSVDPEKGLGADSVEKHEPGGRHRHCRGG
jgi:hypothetical protein